MRNGPKWREASRGSATNFPNVVLPSGSLASFCHVKWTKMIRGLQRAVLQIFSNVVLPSGSLASFCHTKWTKMTRGLKRQCYKFSPTLYCPWKSCIILSHEMDQNNTRLTEGSAINFPKYRQRRKRLFTPTKPGWFTFPAVFQHSNSVRNNTAFIISAIKSSSRV